jgi:hypothetical protein
VFTARYELNLLYIYIFFFFQVNVELSPCEICDGQSGTWIGFTPSTSFSPCQYHSTNIPCSSSSTVCRTHGRSLRTSQKEVRFRKWESIGWKSIFTLLVVERLSMLVETNCACLADHSV